MEFPSHIGFNAGGTIGLHSWLSSYGYGYSNRRTHIGTRTPERRNNNPHAFTYSHSDTDTYADYSDSDTDSDGDADIVCTEPTPPACVDQMILDLSLHADMISEGYIEKAVVVGYDLFNNLGFYGFEALKSIAISDYRPFDRTRDGLILGEACGAVVLEGRRRKAGDFMHLGGANLCDVYSVTSHDEEGAAVAETMNRALRQAGIDPGDICAVKAHATGTENNDRTECAAMKVAFDRHIPPVTCVKPFIGHTAGACGVCELIVFTESVKTGFIPSTPGFREMDEELNLRPLTENREAGEGFFMLNYFGFGGNCTTLILSNRNHTG